MKAYRVIRDGAERADYEGTLSDAHATAKALTPRDAVRIELVEVPTDKEGVLALLNRPQTVTQTFAVEQTWALTARGGLRDVPNGE
jgi:hypothetical protein